MLILDIGQKGKALQKETGLNGGRLKGHGGLTVAKETGRKILPVVIFDKLVKISVSMDK